MVLYSAHDTTVAMVLSALNMTNVDCIVDHYLNGVQNDDSCVWQFPPFSANIIFELWNDSGNYTIQVLYNGEKRKIPICNYSYECTLEQFK